MCTDADTFVFPRLLIYICSNFTFLNLIPFHNCKEPITAVTERSPGHRSFRGLLYKQRQTAIPTPKAHRQSIHRRQFTWYCTSLDCSRKPTQTQTNSVQSINYPEEIEPTAVSLWENVIHVWYYMTENAIFLPFLPVYFISGGPGCGGALQEREDFLSLKLSLDSARVTEDVCLADIK